MARRCVAALREIRDHKRACQAGSWSGLFEPSAPPPDAASGQPAVDLVEVAFGPGLRDHRSIDHFAASSSPIRTTALHARLGKSEPPFGPASEVGGGHEVGVDLKERADIADGAIGPDNADYVRTLFAACARTEDLRRLRTYPGPTRIHHGSTRSDLPRPPAVRRSECLGCPRRLNLRSRDMANMRLALHAEARVLLVGDIDRGGIFAQLLGTLDLLRPDERRLIVGLLVNRFRGDRRMFDGGIQILHRRSKLPVLGVLPYEPELNVPDEDSASLDRPRLGVGSALRAALISYPRVANFDDLDPLRRAGVGVDIVRRPADLGWPDLIVLPGSKSTIDDLLWLRQSGLAAAVMRRAAGGVPVLGICAGYQMLGESLEDPNGVEGPARSMPGLSLLPVVTRFHGPKRTRQVRGTIAVGSALAPSGMRFSGYEIHAGVSRRDDGSPFALITDGRDVPEEDGAVSPDGLVVGTSVHGLFADSHASQAIVTSLAKRRGVAPPSGSPSVDAGAWFRSAVDTSALISITGLGSEGSRRRRKAVPVAAVP